MGPCDLKTVGQAFDDAVDAFKKAFTATNGNMDKSLRYAISETKANYPNIDFDHESLTNPIISSLKKGGLIDANYEFGKKAATNRKKNDNQIGELAKRIAEEKTSQKGPKKESTLTDEEKKLRAHVNSKYGTNLSDDKFRELMNQEVNGTPVKEIVAARVEEEQAEKQAAKEAAEAQKQVQREINSKESEIARKINNAANRMDNMTENQRKDLARELTEAFLEDGILDDDRVKNIYAKVLGLPHVNEEVENMINEMVKNNQELDEADKAIKQAQADAKSDPNSVTIDQVKEMAKRRDEARTRAIDNAKKMAETFRKKGFWISDFADMQPLNLMGTQSLLKNATGVIPDAIVRQFSGGVSAFVNLLMRPFTKANTNPFGAKLKGGASKFRSALREAGLALKFKQRSHAQVPRQDNMSVAHDWKKAIDAHGFKKFAFGVSAVLKISPDIISRVLLATDAIPKSFAYNGELSRIAESKGLKGVEKELFMLNPDEESHQAALDHALDVTFESDIKVPIIGKKLNVSYDHRAAAEKRIAAGESPIVAHTKTALVKIGINLLAPFIKVPTNIVKKSVKLATPELTVLKTIAKTYAERNSGWDVKQKIIADGIGDAAVGFYFRSLALQMVAAGAMTAAYDDEEKPAKNNVEKVAGGTGEINRSALMRLMFLGEKPANKNGDVFIPNTFFGATGITLGAYMSAFSRMTKGELDKYNESFAEKLKPSIGAQAAYGAAKAALDNPFFTAQNNIVQALTDKEGDKAAKFAITMATSLGGGILPATYQKLSMSADPNIVSRYDKEKTFSENLATELGYKFSFMSKGVRKNYFSLAKEEGEAVKKKPTMFFDNYFGRALYANFSTNPHDYVAGTPDEKLYQAAKEVEMQQRGELFPKAIAPKIKMVVKGKTTDIQLTPEQHEYLQEKASNLRMLAATPYIMNPDFEKSTYETRVKKLREYYDEGLNMAIKMTKKQFPDLKNQPAVENNDKLKKENIQNRIVNRKYK